MHPPLLLSSQTSEPCGLSARVTLLDAVATGYCVGMTDSPTDTNPTNLTGPTDSAVAAHRPLVVMDKVNKFFGPLHVLKDIDLTIGEGEVVVIIGPSGSGKSTLCRTINRLETFESGTVRIDGVLLPDEGRELAQLRADVGQQDPVDSDRPGLKGLEPVDRAAE